MTNVSTSYVNIRDILSMSVSMPRKQEAGIFFQHVTCYRMSRALAPDRAQTFSDH